MLHVSEKKGRRGEKEKKTLSQGFTGRVERWEGGGA
jgi:hypothetical protein